MAAGAWKINKNAKLKLGTGSIQLDAGNVFNLTLHSIGASANLISGLVSVFTSIGSECAGGGYTAVGNTLSSNTWAISGQNAKFDASDWVVTGSIASIKYAVIMASVSATSGLVLCYSTLSTTGFDVTGTNTLTIQLNASGIFTLA
jgi:hypothetical protein